MTATSTTRKPSLRKKKKAKGNDTDRKSVV